MNLSLRKKLLLVTLALVLATIVPISLYALNFVRTEKERDLLRSLQDSTTLFEKNTSLIEATLAATAAGIGEKSVGTVQLPGLVGIYEYVAGRLEIRSRSQAKYEALGLKEDWVPRGNSVGLETGRSQIVTFESNLFLASRSPGKNSWYLIYLDLGQLLKDMMSGVAADILVTDLKGSPLWRADPTGKLLIEKETFETGIRRRQLGAKEFYVSQQSSSSLGIRTFVFVDTDVARAEIQRFIVVSTSVIAAVIAILTVLIILSTKSVSRHLGELLRITEEFASGNFGFTPKPFPANELGTLASSLRWMGTKISELIENEKDRLRMSHEIEIAKAVQDTFFPAKEGASDFWTFAGKTEMASECGGDWWSVIPKDERVYFVIGDATGHGIGPAMLTAVVSTATGMIIDGAKELSPSQILGELNRIVCESRSTLSMTFFVGVFTKKDSTLTWASASHEFPFRLHEMEVDYLASSQPGSPLGIDPVAVYADQTQTLTGPMKLILYTDGLTELANDTGQMISEGALRRTIQKHKVDSPAAITAALFEKAAAFANGAPKEDDLSVVVIELKPT